MGTRRVLVVDDSRAMRLILGELLREQGWAVSEAPDGASALAVLRSGAAMPELTLVDWNMPVMNGLDLIRALRADHGFDGMKLMVVTSETEVGQMQQALDAGADEYLMKPFSPEALASKLDLIGLSS